MPSLLADFGHCAENKVNYDAIVDGTYIPPHDVDLFVKKFIAALVMLDSIRVKGVIDRTVTSKNYEQA